MRTTIDLPDEVFRRAKARAALSGVTLKVMITDFVQRGLEGADERPRSARARRQLPVIIAPSGRTMPALTNAEIDAILDEEDTGVVNRHSG